MKDYNTKYVYRTKVWNTEKGNTYYHFIQQNSTKIADYDHRPLKDYEYDDAIKYMDGHLYEMDLYCQKLWQKKERKNKILRIL